MPTESGEGQEFADVVEGVALALFGQAPQGLRPALDQIAQFQLGQPEVVRKIVTKAGMSIRAGAARIGGESHSQLGTVPAWLREARVQGAHSGSELYRDNVVLRQAGQIRPPV